MTAVTVAPHTWAPKGWRYWLYRHCYALKSLHSRRGWVRARPLHDNRYLSRCSPHFEEGW